MDSSLMYMYSYVETIADGKQGITHVLLVDVDVDVDVDVVEDMETNKEMTLFW